MTFRRKPRVNEYRLHGWNPFYDGWLAFIFGEPCEPPSENATIDQDSWRLGWQTALETRGCDVVRHVIGGEREQQRDHIRMNRRRMIAMPHASERKP